MNKSRLLRIAFLALLVVFAQATRTLAGTTGALTGYVVVQSGAAVVAAKVTASAPAETISTTTDKSGHFAFVSLVPDTYTLTASSDGYDTVSQSGITVIADNTRTITIKTEAAVKTLGTVTTRAAGELVKPGTTADVYSINAATQAKVSGLGGGGSLNQAYSALAATPGVVVPPGQMGWFQTIHIRGGDYDQVGYEFDGVPVLRSYDNYPTNTANTLGQQELQVYTGAAPADAQGQGLAGYINQVIKAGTYPGFSTLTAGIGTPALYNGYNFEVGGATPDRKFSYYIGSTNSAQDFRYGDQFNEASLQSIWGTPLGKFSCPTTAPEAVQRNFATCYASGIGPGGYLLAPVSDSVLPANVYDRENVVNLHFGLPHHGDEGRDDVQLLYDASYLNNRYYSSASDWGLSNPMYQSVYGQTVFGPGAPPLAGLPYLAGNLGLGAEYLGAVGAPLANNYLTLVKPVYMAYNPNSVGNGLLYVPLNQRDGTANPNSIVKLQYQHNFGSQAYFRIYGFSNYSEWPQTCPDSLATAFGIGFADCPFNYYVRSNTNGGTAQYGNQINDKNLLTVQLSDIAAIDYRANDETMISTITRANSFAYVVAANNPTAGVCYTKTGAAVSCYSGNEMVYNLSDALAGLTTVTAPGGGALPASCGSGPCEWWTAENGQYGGSNFEKPNYGSFSVRDQIKPSSQLYIDLSAREDRFLYQLANTAANPARTFWFNAWNNSYCATPGAHSPYLNPNGVNAACANDPNTGLAGVPATFTNLPNDSQTFWVFQPRLGATFTANQNNVLRFSAGLYDQAIKAADYQYNLLQQNLPAQLNLTYNFWQYGFHTTTHTLYPQTSDNFDFSWEHHFAGSQASFKLTPYYRVTHNQAQTFWLNQATAFVSDLNTGNQTSDGVEFQLNMGNFNENGLSALLAYTYTHAYIKFSPLGNGTTILDGINHMIQQYNSFTNACAGATPNNISTSLCGAYGNSNAHPTEGSGIANPYYNAPAQGRLDPNGNYVPFTTIPGAIEASAGSYEVPHTATLVLNYKRDKWSLSPQMQFFAGSYYGAPLSGFGVDPASCTAALAGSVSGDPRYPYGGTGTPYDALSCPGTIAIPDPYTHAFDSMGAFRQPNQFLLNAQLSYVASPRVTFTANVANIINTCFGGTKEAWTALTTRVNCGYILPGYGLPLSYGANIYNPGSTFQPMAQYPYQENPIASPVEAIFQMKISL